MDVIYDRDGKAVGWLHGHAVYDRMHRLRAFVQTDPNVFAYRSLGALFSYGRTYLGHFDRGFLRDRAGHAVAWVPGAHDGPLTPVAERPPVHPILPEPSLPPVVPAPPPPTPSTSWSSLTWDEFLGP